MSRWVQTAMGGRDVVRGDFVPLAPEWVGEKDLAWAGGHSSGPSSVPVSFAWQVGHPGISVALRRVRSR